MEVYNCWTLRELGKRLNVPEADLFIHGLEALLKHMPGSLNENLRNAKAVWRSFGVANQWRPSWRYDARPLSADRGRAFLGAIDEVFNWLDASRA